MYFALHKKRNIDINFNSFSFSSFFFYFSSCLNKYFNNIPLKSFIHISSFFSCILFNNLYPFFYKFILNPLPLFFKLLKYKNLAKKKGLSFKVSFTFNIKHKMSQERHIFFFFSSTSIYFLLGSF